MATDKDFITTSVPYITNDVATTRAIADATRDAIGLYPSGASSMGTEGPEKTTREGEVNGSQSKFIVEIWSISRN
jgi:hypothetical protein